MNAVQAHPTAPRRADSATRHGRRHATAVVTAAVTPPPTARALASTLHPLCSLVLSSSSSSCSEGEWLKDLRHGRGAFHCADDGARYEGEWARGCKDGEGAVTLKSGERLAGAWKDGKLTGKVEFTFAEGSRWHSPDL